VLFGRNRIDVVVVVDRAARELCGQGFGGEFCASGKSDFVRSSPGVGVQRIRWTGVAFGGGPDGCWVWVGGGAPEDCGGCVVEAEFL
jgi:hypothetical protein